MTPTTQFTVTVDGTRNPIHQPLDQYSPEEQAELVSTHTFATKQEAQQFALLMLDQGHAVTLTTAIAPQTTFLGYRVEKLPEDPNRKVQPCYYLYGPKGALYGLYRNLNTPHLLFACSGRTGKPLRLKGHEWFTDKKGYLEIAG